jgi:hypothetical protein
MDKKRLEELKKLCEDATPGPWEVKHQPTVGTAIYYDVSGPSEASGCHRGLGDCNQMSCICYSIIEDPQKTDADLIAASRTALPELIAEVEFLTKVVEQMQEWARFPLAGKGDSIYMDENPDRMTVESHPELAQYLKRGKE